MTTQQLAILVPRSSRGFSDDNRVLAHEYGAAVKLIFSVAM